MILSEINSLYHQNGINNMKKLSYKWYYDESKHQSNDVVYIGPSLLQPGKIHTFDYNPIHKSTLDYYDKNPVVISLGTLQRGNTLLEMGINLNFIPMPYKWYILDTIQKSYQSFFVQQQNKQLPADKQPLIKYNYNFIKSILRQYGVLFALRTYIPTRKRNINVISYNQWTKCAFLSIEDFEKITYEQMIDEYEKFKKK